VADAARNEDFDPLRLGLRGADVFRVLLSLLALSPQRQRRLLPGIPSRGDPRARELKGNPLLALSFALHYTMPAWCRAHDPGRDATWVLDECLEEIDLTAASGEVGAFCLESFLADRSWRMLRRDARELLEELGLEPAPIHSPLPIFELVKPSAGS
jgi:hypothetical protein